MRGPGLGGAGGGSSNSSQQIFWTLRRHRSRRLTELQQVMLEVSHGPWEPSQPSEHWQSLMLETWACRAALLCCTAALWQ